MKKFYNFSFDNPNEVELYLYGDIVSEKWEENDVTFEDFKSKLDTVPNNGVLNIFQNSGGGDCMVAASMCSLIKRAQDRGVKIIATIDSLSASASSWISCAADELRIYNHSILMLHKPLTFSFGAANADTMKKEIEVLDTIQNGVMLPIYMSKAKEGITEEMIQDLVNNETWMDSKQIQKYFNCTLLEGEAKRIASVGKNILNKYKNIPSELKELLNKEGELVEDNKEEIEAIEESKNEVVDEVIEDSIEPEEIINEKEGELENLKNIIEVLTNEKLELETKLNEAKEKAISLNDKVSELQPIVDKYNKELEIKNKLEEENKLKEKRDYYRNRFEKLGAKTKFESEEIQSLVDNCIKDNEAISKLNSILVDLVDISSTEQKSVLNRVESVSNIGSLIDVEEDITSKYGFK